MILTHHKSCVHKFHTRLYDKFLTLPYDSHIFLSQVFINFTLGHVIYSSLCDWLVADWSRAQALDYKRKTPTGGGWGRLEHSKRVNKPIEASGALQEGMTLCVMKIEKKRSMTVLYA